MALTAKPQTADPKHRKSWADQRLPHAPTAKEQQPRRQTPHDAPRRWIEAKGVRVYPLRCRTSPAWPGGCRRRCPLHTMGCAPGLNRRRCTGPRPAAANDVVVGATLFQPDAARIPGSSVVGTCAPGRQAIEAPGLSLDTIADQIRCGGIDFGIEQAAGTGDFRPLARLSLIEILPPGRDMAFDPVLHTAPGVKLLPGWLADFRRAAYRRSRRGRDAE